VRYGSIGGLEYEVPQSRLYCLRINVALLDGLAMYLSCDTKKFHDNESAHILHNFWTSTHRGEASPPPGGATAWRCLAYQRGKENSRMAWKQRDETEYWMMTHLAKNIRYAGTA